MSDVNDVIRSLRSTFERVGEEMGELAQSWTEFLDIPEKLTYPVVWCKDHDQLEGNPGCLLAQARRSA